MRFRSDCEETDFFWESWTSPGKRKRKKKPQKDKICVKDKNSITIKTNGHTEKKKKKKKNSKFKEAMEERREKKKGRKKKSLLHGLDDGYIFMQGYSGASDTIAPEASYPRSVEKSDHLTQDSKKKAKRKKKVAFDLPPGYIHVKRPKLISPSPKELIVSEKEAVRDSNSCSQTAVTGYSQSQPFNNDSQCSSDDINSQDLFITQKTFRTVLSEPSSGEVSDKALTATLQTITQQENKIQIVLTEGEEEEEENPKTQIQLNTNLTKEKTVSGHVKRRAVNPYLDDPVVVNCSMDLAKPKKGSCTSSCLAITDKHLLLPLKSTANMSTQTENFFTTELSYYLSFCQKSGVTVFDNLKPLDLSLPKRARKGLEDCLLAKMSGNEDRAADKKLSYQKRSSSPEQARGKGHADPNLRPSCSADMNYVELKTEPAVQQRRSVSARRKSKTTPSPQPECEPKSADTTSSEDNAPLGHTGKLDLMQVRAVQMRLNESFFFKTKGEGQSPRPESPLMKLVQSRETKSRKGH